MKLTQMARAVYFALNYIGERWRVEQAYRYWGYR